MFRILSLISLVLFNSHLYADSFEILKDHNDRVTASNSSLDFYKENNPLAYSNKIYSFAQIDGERINERVLTVIDKNTKDGKVIEALKAYQQHEFIDHLIHDGKIFVFVKNKDRSFDTDVWVIDSEDDSTQHKTTIKFSDIFVAGREFKPYSLSSDTILLHVSGNKYITLETNSFIASVKNFDQALSSPTEYYTLGNNIFYSLNNQIWKYDFSSERSELFSTSAYGQFHIEIDNFIYYFSNTGDSNDNPDVQLYDLYSNNGSSIRLEMSNIELNNFEQPKITKAGNAIIFIANNNKIISKLDNDQDFNALEYDFRIYPLDENGFEYVFKDDFFYFLVRISPTDNGFKEAIIKTDLKSVFENLVTNESNLQWSLLFEDEEQISLLESNPPAVFDAFLNLRNKCYEVTENGALVESHVFQNLNFKWKVEEDNGQYVFADSVENGVEPRFISCATKEQTLIADFNKNLDNAGSYVIGKGNSSRLIAHYQNFFNGNRDWFDVSDSKFDMLDTSSIPNYFDGPSKPELIDVDDKYLYVDVRAGVNTVYQIAYNFEDMSSTRIDISTLGVQNNTKSVFTRGDHIKIGHGSLIKSGVDRRVVIDIPNSFTRFSTHKDSILLFEQYPSDGNAKFRLISNDSNNLEFSIPCGTQCNSIEVVKSNSSLLLENNIDSETSDYYLFNYEQSKPAVFLQKNFNSDRGGIKLLQSSAEFSLLSIRVDNTQKLYKFNHYNEELTELLSDVGWYPEVRKLGNYYAGITEDLTLFSLDSEFNLQRTINLDSQRYDAFKNNFFECDAGYCYLNLANKGSFFFHSSDLIKFNKDLDILESIPANARIFSALFKKNNYIILKATTKEFSDELYIINRTFTDIDSDGIDDNYELAFDFAPNSPNDSNLDIDNDGLTNLEEYLHRTDPHNSDTDSDGISDGDELAMSMNPAEYDLHLIDHDNDGASFRVEQALGTDINNNDTDGDGLLDGEDDEPLSDRDQDGIMDGIDPDDDNDGVLDEDDTFPYDPTESSDNDADGIGDNSDTDDDNDGMPDSWEQQYGLDPLSSADRNLDPDNDTFTNHTEYLNGTNPTVFDPSGATVPQPDNPPSGGSGGGGSSSIWLLLMLFTYLVTSRRIYK